MYRLAVTLFLCSAAVALDAPEAEIVRAAESPYDLARYLRTHTDFNWGPLWLALGIKSPASNEPCVTAADRHAACSIQTVSIAAPSQVIVVVGGDRHQFELYLRFLQNAGGNWTFAGAYGAFIKGIDPMHQVTRLDGKSFLRVAIQGPNFGPVPNNREIWFDLTRRDFDPVLSFPTFAGQDVFIFPFPTITRQVTGKVIPNGAESVDVVLSVSFSLIDAELGSRRFTGRFERHAGEKKFSFGALHLLPEGSSIPDQDFS